MAAIPYPFVNGDRHSFASIEMKLNGQIFLGIKSIDYSRTRNRELVRGTHPDPLGKTVGENDYKASVEVYLAEWNQFQNSLSLGGTVGSAVGGAIGGLVGGLVAGVLGGGYGSTYFTVTVTYSA